MMQYYITFRCNRNGFCYAMKGFIFNVEISIIIIPCRAHIRALESVQKRSMAF